MTLNLTMPEREELKPKITVFGVGGAGGNAVNNMIEKELVGVDFVVANTDAQALQQSKAQARVQMGVKVTEGLGAGARPSVGAAAAEETIEEIVDHLAGAHMCFITAGMGGGTGTGAAPIIAQAARELGVLTVGVVTKPFQFEGAKRMRQAEEGVEQLQKMVDTLIIIPNQNLFRLANEKTTFTEAFSLADDVLYQGVKGVTDLMVRPGLINLDFADVRAVMDEMGKAMMGTGEATGEDRATQAAEKAIANPLLDEISLRGAKGVLINITGGTDLTLFELDEAANRIREEVDADANIIVGSTMDASMDGSMRVSVVATGIDASEVVGDIPVPRRRLSEPLTAAAGVIEEAAAAPKIAVQAQVPTQAPAQAHAPAAPAAPTPAQARETDEPMLFDAHDAEAAAAREQAEDIFEDSAEVPEPVYRPKPPAPAAPIEEEAASFTAPKPGEPSDATMRRLREAVQRAPLRATGTSSNPGPAPSPVAAPRPAAAPAAEERQSFGLKSMIGRMTGHAGAQSEPQPQPRVQPQMQPSASPSRSTPQSEDTRAEADQERIEIPAFLRRQAN